MRASLRRLLSTVGAAVLLFGLAAGTPATAEPTDTAAPVLRSISAPTGPYVPGQQVTWTLDIVDTSDIRRVQIEYRTPDPSPGYFFVNVVPPAGWRTGQLSWTIPGTPTTAPHDGMYEATAVMITDQATHEARYFADGVLDTRPYAGSSEHGIDVRAPMSITQSPRDRIPPVLTMFTLPDAPVHGAFEVPYAVTDLEVYSMSVYGRASGGDEVVVGFEIFPPTTGLIEVRPFRLGSFEVTRVVVKDTIGNSATYSRDGTFTTVPSGGKPPQPHALDLARSVTVLPQAPTAVSSVARSGGTTLTWSQAWEAGHHITVSPGGGTLTGAPSVAVDRRSAWVPLPNGITSTLTITPTTPQGDGPSVSINVTPRMSAKVFGAGDRSGDGRADLWATGFGDASSEARWRLYTAAGAGRFGRTLQPMAPYAVYTGFPGSSTGRGPGASSGSLYLSGNELRQPEPTSGSSVVGRGFQVFRTIDASSDLTGDGVADLIGITPAGDFYRYTSSSTGAIGSGVRLGGGWGTFHAVFAPGDFDGDRRADVIAVDSLGTLWLYPGNGRGGFGVRKQIGSGWGGFGSVFPMRDFSGDGNVDIGAITMDGRLFMYPGNGRGSFLTSSQIGTGWSAFL